MKSKKPILITGSPRSGTTWIGRMIAESPAVGYIHEPFHLNHRPGICGAKFDYWFTYIPISEGNESIVYKHIKNTIAFRYNIIGEFKAIRYLRDVARMLRDYIKFSMYRLCNVRPLLKDPIAVFSAEWLASTFNMDVIVLIRHPAAVVSSFKRLNWKHSFSHFLAQPLLIRDHLYPFEAEIKEYVDKEHDIIDQAILLWRLIYHMVIKYKKKHSDWIFIRHEDLARDPLHGFQTLFKRLNLKFSERVREIIKEYSNPSNPSEPPKASDIKRNSKATIWNWKSKLTMSEIQRIRSKVEEISSAFYSDEDW